MTEPEFSILVTVWDQRGEPPFERAPTAEEFRALIERAAKGLADLYADEKPASWYLNEAEAVLVEAGVIPEQE